MTLKEKMQKATILAARIKMVASRLRSDARDFDCRFPLEHAKQLEEMADEFLKLK